MDSSTPEVKSSKEDYVDQHVISALLYLFCTDEIKELSGKMNAKKLEVRESFLENCKKFGIITDNTKGKLQFIHRCFAEYFAAK